MARGLLEAGASVYISSRKAEAGEKAVAELSKYGVVLSVPADLSREEECLRLAAEVGRSEEGVHVLVNNAGTNWGAALEDFPATGWDKVVDLNLKTPFYLTRAFLPLLEAAGTADDPARVINIGSIDGLRVPELHTYSYSASKAGLHQLTRVLARELGPRHITVNAVAPGPFESKMMAATLAQQSEQIGAARLPTDRDPDGLLDGGREHLGPAGAGVQVAAAGGQLDAQAGRAGAAAGLRRRGAERGETVGEGGAVAGRGPGHRRVQGLDRGDGRRVVVLLRVVGEHHQRVLVMGLVP